MRPRFHSGHMLWWRHAYSHTHTHTHSYSWACVLIVSICSLWWCAAHKLAFSPRSSDKTEAVSPQLGCPRSITQPSYTHTHTHNSPLSHKATAAWGPLIGPCVTLGPLCLIRCYNQTTKGLWHRDLPSILHTLTEQDKCVCVCLFVCLQKDAMQGTEKETMNENNKSRVPFSPTCKLC